MIGHEKLYISRYDVTVEQVMAKYGPRFRLKIEDGAIQVPVGGLRKKLESHLKLDAQIAGTGDYAPRERIDITTGEVLTETAAPTVTMPAARTATTHRCHFCGGTWAVTRVHDMSGIAGYVCGHHSRDFAEGLGCFA